MIEIYVGGSLCYECDMELQALHEIMMDEFIKPETFIKVNLNDGCVGYIRKGSIISFNNVAETGRR